MTREFVRLPEFEKQCMQVGLDEDDINEIENALLDNSKIGTVIKGTGGIRKVRVALQNRGKSSGARVIYIDFERYKKVYLITVFSKNVVENLTMAEKNKLKSMIGVLKAELKKKG
jgi:hypothetical protein